MPEMFQNMAKNQHKEEKITIKMNKNGLSKKVKLKIKSIGKRHIKTLGLTFT